LLGRVPRDVDGRPQPADLGEVLAHVPVQLPRDCGERICVTVGLGVGQLRRRASITSGVSIASSFLVL